MEWVRIICTRQLLMGKSENVFLFLLWKCEISDPKTLHWRAVHLWYHGQYMTLLMVSADSIQVLEATFTLISSNLTTKIFSFAWSNSPLQSRPLSISVDCFVKWLAQLSLLFRLWCPCKFYSRWLVGQEMYWNGLWADTLGQSRATVPFKAFHLGGPAKWISIQDSNVRLWMPWHVPWRQNAESQISKSWWFCWTKEA